MIDVKIWEIRCIHLKYQVNRNLLNYNTNFCFSTIDSIQWNRKSNALTGHSNELIEFYSNIIYAKICFRLNLILNEIVSRALCMSFETHMLLHQDIFFGIKNVTSTKTKQHSIATNRIAWVFGMNICHCFQCSFSSTELWMHYDR